MWILSIVSFVNSLYWYRTVYTIGGIFATKKFKEAKNLHKYAVLIAARNEQTVIGNLIESINNQKKHGISHGLKPAFSKEHQERMTEEQMYNTPWMGTVKPWKEAVQEDLPAVDDSKDW